MLQFEHPHLIPVNNSSQPAATTKLLTIAALDLIQLDEAHEAHEAQHFMGKAAQTAAVQYDNYHPTESSRRRYIYI